MPRYADILLPLATNAYTYAVPSALASAIEVGRRVAVELGRAKTYAGVVVALRDEPPAGDLRLKPVLEVLDSAPVVRPEGLKFWHWLAHYYMCTPGEVMRAALPAGMRLESETIVARAEDFSDEASLTERGRRVVAALDAGKALTVGELERSLGEKRLLPVVRRLMERGAVVCCEHLREKVRPRAEAVYRLAPEWCDPARIDGFLAAQRAGSRQAEALRLFLKLTDFPLAPEHKDIAQPMENAAQEDEAPAAHYADLTGAPADFAPRNADLAPHHAELSPENAQLTPVPEAPRALLTAEGARPAALRALQDKGILLRCSRPVPDACPITPDALAPRPALSLAQTEALESVRRALTQHDCCLLHGVTGSGKTEIYIRLIESALAEGRQALLMLPEIALTAQITERLARVFGPRMGVYHSKFADAERTALWRRMAAGGAAAPQVVVGVRSSVFLPFERLGIVIVDEEHETSYKQQDPAPRYHARDAVMMLARGYDAKVVLGTATPSVETYAAAQAGRYGLVTLAERYAGAQLPEIVVEDVRRLRFTRRMRSAFAPRLVDEVRRALAEGGQAILFQNRRGYAPVLACRACGWTPRCDRCDVSLAWHEQAARLVCHYCGKSFPRPAACPCCGSTELRDEGWGTEKIAKLAAETFEGARIVRMDLDTTRSRRACERIIADFAAGRADILVGTQMVTKGLDFDRVRVVGILSADQMLSQPDFRAHERAFQMMSQVAGRAGRKGSRRGLVVLQTRQADAQIVDQVARGDYRAMFEAQMAERRAFLYPPLCRLIRIDVRHRAEPCVEAAARRLAALLVPHFGDRLLGPDRPAVGRVQSLYIRRLLLKVDPALPPSGVRRTLEAARRLVLDNSDGRGASIVFDVDPC